MKAKLLVEHVPDCWAVEAVERGDWDTTWWWPKRAVELRDKVGRLKGARRGWMPEWAALECNSIKCAARATIPVESLLLQAQRDLEARDDA